MRAQQTGATYPQNDDNIDIDDLVDSNSNVYADITSVASAAADTPTNETLSVQAVEPVTDGTDGTQPQK